MKSFFCKKIVTPFVAVLIALASIAGTWGVGQLPAPGGTDTTPEGLYKAAVLDSMVAEADELQPLVTLTKDSDMTTWKDGKILLLSWHKYPESYVQGSEVQLSYGELWTFTDKEIRDWYQKNKNGVSDWNLRFRQLIGLPPTAEYTHFTAFWADPKDVYRPAYQWDITDGSMSTSFEEDYPETFTGWFDSNILYSYYQCAYPWTRLGYTYDWANNGTEYGLSEFLIAKDATATVEFTKTTDEFVQWLGEAA